MWPTLSSKLDFYNDFVVPTVFQMIDAIAGGKQRQKNGNRQNDVQKRYDSLQSSSSFNTPKIEPAEYIIKTTKAAYKNINQYRITKTLS